MSEKLKFLNNDETNKSFSFINHDILGLKNLSPSSFMNSSNISYYQHFPYNSPTINNTPSNNSVDYSNASNNNEQQSFNYEESTPKMNFDCNENQNTFENNQNDKELNKIPLKQDINITNEETKTSSLNNKPQIDSIVKISNIVSTADLSCQFNLKAISLQAKNSEYNPKRFSGLIMRIKEPKTTALIFSTGKIVVLGAKTEEDSKNACRKYGKILKSLGYTSIVLKKFKIQNIVSSCKVNFNIKISRLYIHMKGLLYSDKVHYEPELFPGLIYHYIDENNLSNPTDNQLNLVFLVFSSGNIVIAGAKNRHQAYNAFEKFYPLLFKFAVKDEEKN